MNFILCELNLQWMMLSIIWCELYETILLWILKWFEWNFNKQFKDWNISSVIISSPVLESCTEATATLCGINQCPDALWHMRCMFPEIHLWTVRHANGRILTSYLTWYVWLIQRIFYSFRGNDGNFSTDHHYCVHTKPGGEFRPWWVVDLEDTIHVTHVTLTNRAGCCRNNYFQKKYSVFFLFLNLNRICQGIHVSNNTRVVTSTYD